MAIEEKLALEIANEFITAEEKRTPIDPITAAHPELTIDDAYRVQLALVAAKQARGEKLIGKKVGATNATAQKNFGLDGPVFAHLFSSFQVANGGTVPVSKLISPRIECETTFLLKKDLVGPGISSADVLAATDAVMASFEINDCRTRDWKPGKFELVADNVVAARFVTSEKRVSVDGLDLSKIRVVLKKNGAQVAEATGANVLGNPANSVAWLANKLAEYNLRLAAGEIVMPGSLTPMLPVVAGDFFEATFDVLGSVSVRFV